MFHFGIKDAIDTWSTGIHCPLLYVTRNSTVEDTIRISYTNFNKMDEYRIHVTYTTNSSMNFELSNIDYTYELWLSPIINEMYIYDTDYNDWIIVNLQQSGKY